MTMWPQVEVPAMARTVVLEQDATKVHAPVVREARSAANPGASSEPWARHAGSRSLLRNVAVADQVLLDHLQQGKHLALFQRSVACRERAVRYGRCRLVESYLHLPCGRPRPMGST